MFRQNKKAKFLICGCVARKAISLKHAVQSRTRTVQSVEKSVATDLMILSTVQNITNASVYVQLFLTKFKDGKSAAVFTFYPRLEFINHPRLFFLNVPLADDETI